MNYNEDENSSFVTKLNMNSFALIGLFISLIVSCVIIYYVALPMYKDARIIKAGNEVKEENIRNNSLLLDRVVKANKENKELDNESVEKIKDFISNRNNYEDHLIYIVKLANSKNIKINDFSVNEKKDSSKINDDNTLKEIEINLTASSGFLNLVNFLKSIEGRVPLIQEESISVSVGDKNDRMSENEDPGVKTDTESILDYEVKLKFYHY
ncbi:MAG: hypothetical protein KAJ19_15075 [Gammaproteobacteria bacterium]|nr:hypothetical protein [Gammaproteobacteria bacterium]